MAENLNNSYINSLIGVGTQFNGELELDGLLRVDGDFSGSIQTTGKVLIGNTGRVKCTISASTVVIGGAVKGDIHASEKVVVLSTGLVVGNIRTPRLIVEEGVVLNGRCIITGQKTTADNKFVSASEGVYSVDWDKRTEGR